MARQNDPPAFRFPRRERRGGGLFVCLEGLDGSGKSTQAALLAEALGPEAAPLREPSSGGFGRELRLAAATLRHKPLAEHRLFLRDRGWDLKFNILPALSAGKTVVLDRYIISNIIYQGASGIPAASIARDNSRFPWPDLTVVLKIGVPAALRRIELSGRKADLFETEAFLNKARSVMDSLEGAGLPDTVFLDGELSEKALAEKIAGLVAEAKSQISPAAGAGRQTCPP